MERITLRRERNRLSAQKCRKRRREELNGLSQVRLSTVVVFSIYSCSVYLLCVNIRFRQRDVNHAALSSYHYRHHQFIFNLLS